MKYNEWGRKTAGVYTLYTLFSFWLETLSMMLKVVFFFF